MAIPLGQTLACKTQSRTAEEAAPKIMWEPENLKDWSVNGKAQVEKTIFDLQNEIARLPANGPITAEMIPQIAAIYGANGIMTGYDGKTYRGDREISKYFGQLVACRTVEDLQIRIKFVYAEEFTRAKMKDGRDDDVIHSLYYILLCSYRVDVRVVDPLSSTSCGHIRVCDCDRSK